MEQSDFQNLYEFTSGLLTLPNLMNSRLSQLLFLVSQHFRVSLFQGHIPLEIFEKEDSLISVYFLGQYGDQKSPRVELKISKREALEDSVELEDETGGEIVSIEKGQILIMKSRRIRVEDCKVQNVGDKAFLGSLSLVARSQFKNKFGF